MTEKEYLFWARQFSYYKVENQYLIKVPDYLYKDYEKYCADEEKCIWGRVAEKEGYFYLSFRGIPVTFGGCHPDLRVSPGL